MRGREESPGGEGFATRETVRRILGDLGGEDTLSRNGEKLEPSRSSTSKARYANTDVTVRRSIIPPVRVRSLWSPQSRTSSPA
jgi:hypothetical protein